MYHICNTVFENTVKSVLRDDTNYLMTNGSLMKGESIAFCNTFDLH